jgi:hypothetical protein
MHFFAVTALAVLFVAAPAAAQTRPDARAALVRDAERLTALWSGWYDTANQVRYQERFDFPEAQWVSRQLKIYAPVELPAFGPYVTYVEQLQGSPPDTVFRQRLYVHSIDETRGQVVTDIWAFTDEDAKRVAGAHEDPGKLAGISPDAMTKLPDGCEIFWERRGQTFLGIQYAERCLYEPPGFSRPMRLADLITLDKTAMTTRTELFDSDGNRIMGNEAGVAEVSRKARRFDCDLFALNPDVEGGVERYPGIESYDQGGEFTVSTRHDPPKEILVRLLNISPPAGSSRDSFFLEVREENGLIPTTRAFVAPDATRVAVSSSGVEVSCNARELESARL